MLKMGWRLSVKVGDLVKHTNYDILGIIVKAVAEPYIAEVSSTITIYSILWDDSEMTEEEGSFNLEVVSECR